MTYNHIEGYRRHKCLGLGWKILWSIELGIIIIALIKPSVFMWAW